MVVDLIDTIIDERSDNSKSSRVRTLCCPWLLREGYDVYNKEGKSRDSSSNVNK